MNIGVLLCRLQLLMLETNIVFRFIVGGVVKLKPECVLMMDGLHGFDINKEERNPSSLFNLYFKTLSFVSVPKATIHYL